MTSCALALALSLACAGMPAYAGHPALQATGSAVAEVASRGAEPGDRWVAQDKVRHLGMSFAATSFAYGGARTVADADAAFIAAALTALALGIGKEVHDVRAGRWFSFKDMVWNAAGVTLGLTLVHRVR
jgi:uncharacterized protein YfiM (DUF2279 family)